MKKRFITGIILCCAMMLTFAACTKTAKEEVNVTEEVVSEGGRGENYLTFQNEETVQDLETLKIEMVDSKGNTLEEINVEGPKASDKYCISPVITDDLKSQGAYTVIFTVNEKDTWERTFSIEDCENDIHTNVIDIYEEDGEIHYESCLAQ